jgi:hypothetical protein
MKADVFLIPLANQNARLNTSSIARSTKAETHDEQRTNNVATRAAAKSKRSSTDHLARNGFAA